MQIEGLRIEEPGPGVSILAVRAQPGAKRSGARGVHDGRLRVALRAPAEGGRANEELLDWLARRLDLRARDLELLSGERAREKRVRVPLDASHLRARLAACDA